MKHGFGLFPFVRDPDEGGSGGAEPPADPPAERTFTQTELDRIVQERVARVKREAPADYEELKAKAEKFDAAEADKLSELEKAQQAREAAEKRAAEALARANKRLVEAAVIAEAAAQNALKPEHMPRLIDTGSVTVGDDGQVTGVQEALKSFLEANPEYVGKGRPATGSVDQGARGSTPGITREDLAKMSSAEIVKAQQEGRLDHLTAGS